MFARLFASAAMTLAIISASASPVETDLEFAPEADVSLLSKRSTFQWRFCTSYPLSKIVIL